TISTSRSLPIISSGLCFLLGIHRPFRGPNYHSLWATQRGADQFSIGEMHITIWPRIFQRLINASRRNDFFRSENIAILELGRIFACERGWGGLTIFLAVLEALDRGISEDISDAWGKIWSLMNSVERPFASQKRI
ncbi:hypothetical protein ACKU27_27135, partial [Sphingobium yanoikuyae]|uniref:hypothetical protein n=1 Tax=Sphingobium yanoikuyae TaxID=13690 RepID=UPI003B8F9660